MDPLRRAQLMVLVAVTAWLGACAHSPAPNAQPAPKVDEEPQNLSERPVDPVQPPEPPRSLPLGPPTCAECGPAPMYPTSGCKDVRYQGGRGPCVRRSDGTCSWLRLTCPEAQAPGPRGECTAQECGAPPAMTKWLCPNRKDTGELGRCIRDRNGRCGWVHRFCPGVAQSYIPERDQRVQTPPPAPPPRPPQEYSCADLPGASQLKKWEVRSICSPGSGPAPPPITRIKSLDDGTHIFEMRGKCFRGRYRQCFTKCLPPAALIDTPAGQVAVAALRIGMPIWTRDDRGRRIAGHVHDTVTVPVTAPHDMARIQLRDGRSVTVSLQHPALTGLVEDLRIGDAYDGSTISAVEILPYAGATTHDVLPSGDSGVYWANGILLRSTLR